ncbi:hypothetical protein TNCV_5122721 [Trichonephila clavipes]|nr:hypothetical protein TNCV_5122721 [Trichonephila clavipes]
MDDDVISRLKKCKEIVRTSVTKQKKRIETDSRNETPDNLEIFVEILKEFTIELELLDREIHKIIYPKQLETDFNTAMEHREKITIWKFRAYLNQEEMTTVLFDAKSVLNSRTLTFISKDPDELIVLSPSVFLQEIRELGIPDLDCMDSKK